MSTPNPPSVLPSLVRTIVPVIVGALLTALLKLGVHVDEGTATEVVGVVLTSGYYAGVRYLETRYPQVGWLLGLAKAPAYSPDDPPQEPPGIIDGAHATAADVEGIQMQSKTDGGPGRKIPGLFDPVEPEPLPREPVEEVPSEAPVQTDNTERSIDGSQPDPITAGVDTPWIGDMR